MLTISDIKNLFPTNTTFYIIGDDNYKFKINNLLFGTDAFYNIGILPHCLITTGNYSVFIKIGMPVEVCKAWEKYSEMEKD